MSRIFCSLKADVKRMLARSFTARGVTDDRESECCVIRRRMCVELIRARKNSCDIFRGAVVMGTAM